MTLRTCLAEKFPKAGKDEILRVRKKILKSNQRVTIGFKFWVCICVQVVGNLIYYRYMNPAIVAPDAFDIVDVTVDKSLTVEQVGIWSIYNYNAFMRHKGRFYPFWRLIHHKHILLSCRDEILVRYQNYFKMLHPIRRWWKWQKYRCYHFGCVSWFDTCF